MTEQSSKNKRGESPTAELAFLRKRVAELERSNALFEARETRYRELIERVHDMVWTVDLSGAVTFLNSACQGITGYSRQELLGKNLADLVAPENLQSAQEALSRKWGGEQSRRSEIRILAKNGAPVDLEVTSALIERDGRAAGILAIARDVTDRKEAQETLRQSAQNFEDLFATHPLPMWVFELATLQYLAVNQAAMDKYGYSREEFLAMQATALRPPGEGQRFLAYLGNLPMECRGNAGRWRHLAKNGRIIDVEVSWRRVTFGGREAILSVIQDISERKLLEEQLRQAQKLEAVGRLAGGVAHDFNNILTVICGYSQLLLNRIDLEHPMRSGLDHIRQSADKAAVLTRQLLAFSRRQSLQPGILDLNQIVADMEKMLRRLVGEHIELATRLDPDLGRVQADPSQIEQVILNLVLNAREAMPQGGAIALETQMAECPAAESAAGRKPGLYPMLSVTDTGTGIGEEIRGLLFDPFFTTRQEREGAGLGLSAVHGMVEQHGGFIRVLSQPGEGARFEVFLPPTPDPDEMPVFAACAMRGTETILVVEDEGGVLRLIGETLRGYGYTVLESSDSARALEMAHASEPRIDLLLTDIVMPKVNGRALAEAWKSLHPEVKVLFMSGYSGEASSSSPACPAFPLLQKPFSGLKLSQAVRESLDGSSD